MTGRAWAGCYPSRSRRPPSTASLRRPAARAALPQHRYAALLEDLDDLMRSMNTATDGGLAYDAEYARVVARKPG